MYFQFSDKRIEEVAIAIESHQSQSKQFLEKEFQRVRQDIGKMISNKRIVLVQLTLLQWNRFRIASSPKDCF